MSACDAFDEVVLYCLLRIAKYFLYGSSSAGPRSVSPTRYGDPALVSLCARVKQLSRTVAVVGATHDTLE